MLTEKEGQVLDAIIEYIGVNGFSPTVREIGDKVGLKSSSNAHSYLKGLEEKGYIERKANSPRALRIVKS